MGDSATDNALWYGKTVKIDSSSKKLYRQKLSWFLYSSITVLKIGLLELQSVSVTMGMWECSVSLFICTKLVVMPNLQLELILEFPDKLEVSKHGEQTALASVFCMVVCGALKYLHGNDAEQIGIITCLRFEHV